MAFVAYALPILPGQSGRTAGFGTEMTPELRQHYETLNRDQHIRRHMEWVQPSPIGDLLIVVFESDTPEKMMRDFDDNPYDNWWRKRVEALHGFDPGDPNVHPIMPALTWDWTNEDASTGRS